MVTLVPMAAKMWANSAAMMPPPAMMRLSQGFLGYLSPKKLSLVRYPASSSPAMGGMPVSAPVAIRYWLPFSCASPPSLRRTIMSLGPVKYPSPLNTVTLAMWEKLCSMPLDTSI